MAELVVDVIAEGSIRSCSAGTEATEFNYRMVSALHSLGIELNSQGGSNPMYTWEGHKNYWSKTVDDLNGAFIAVMVCTEADSQCPAVLGAAGRFSLPYEDPKASDGSPQEAEDYKAKVMEVGREMSYLIRRITRRSAP